MAKTIEMPLEEYQADFNNAKAMGSLEAMMQICDFMQSGKKASEFFGVNFLDLKNPHHSLLIRFVSLFGQQDEVLKMMKQPENTPAPAENAPACCENTPAPETQAA